MPWPDDLLKVNDLTTGSCYRLDIEHNVVVHYLVGFGEKQAIT